VVFIVDINDKAFVNKLLTNTEYMVCTCVDCNFGKFAFSALLVEWQEGHLACKKYGGMVEVGTG